MDVKRLMELSGVTGTLQQQLFENIQELNEVTDPSNMTMEQLMAAMDAAKKGLSIAHKLSDPAEKKKHFGRVMTNMNKIRGALKRMAKEMGVEDAA